MGTTTDLPAPLPFRRPRQARSRQRFEAILDGAERLLETQEADAISIYDLAEATAIAAPSIYHFFPEATHVMLALAERYLQRFAKSFEQPPASRIETWQDLQAARFGEARDVYNHHAPARRLLLGSGSTPAIRARDLAINRELAVAAANETARLFVIPAMPDLADRITELIVVSDALWSVSVHAHGVITDEAFERSRRMREAYTRTFLPEYAPLRRVAD